MPALQCPRCFECGVASVVEITDEEYLQRVILDEKVQVAFPERSADFREMIVTGTHSGCWMTMFCDMETAQMDFQDFMWKWCALTGITLMGRTI